MIEHNKRQIELLEEDLKMLFNDLEDEREQACVNMLKEQIERVQNELRDLKSGKFEPNLIRLDKDTFEDRVQIFYDRYLIVTIFLEDASFFRHRDIPEGIGLKLDEQNRIALID